MAGRRPRSGAGTAVASAPRPGDSDRPRPASRAHPGQTIALALAGIVALTAASAVVPIVLFRVGWPMLPALLTHATGIPLDSKPAEWKYDAVDHDALVAACHRLMADPSTRGHYVDPARLARARKVGNYLCGNKDPKARPVASLPAVLKALKPIEVIVSSDQVNLGFRGLGYGYGYYLIVLRDPKGKEAKDMRAHDRDFNRTVEIAPGVWSFFPFH